LDPEGDELLPDNDLDLSFIPFGDGHETRDAFHMVKSDWTRAVGSSAMGGSSRIVDLWKKKRQSES
jgi:hypothetical protein